MTELIVLGAIPGTSLQINFIFWLGVIAGLGVLIIYVIYRRNRFVVYRWIATYLSVLVLTKNTIQLRQLA